MNERVAMNAWMIDQINAEEKLSVKIVLNVIKRFLTPEQFKLASQAKTFQDLRDAVNFVITEEPRDGEWQVTMPGDE